MRSAPAQFAEVSKAIKEADTKYKISEKASLAKQVSELTSDIEGEQTELDAVLDYYEKLKSTGRNRIKQFVTSRLISSSLR